ncbi:TPA: hypothetical protein DIV55_05885 [Patescibacteria group bacterium]|nr:hypothetical protein [Patescibacteria group bacterium]
MIYSSLLRWVSKHNASMYRKKEQITSSRTIRSFFFSTALVLFLIFLWVISLQYPDNPNPQKQLQTQLAWQSNHPVLINTLSQKYLQHGMTQQARILTNPFVTSAIAAAPTAIVLNTSSQTATSTQPLTEIELLQQQLYWEQVAQQYPNYRDAWVQLYYLQLGQNQEDVYLQQIIKLDPLTAATLPR